MTDELVVLGSGTAVQTAHRDNTACAFRMDESAVVIDCPGSAVLKLLRAGIDPIRIDAVVITHTHPDHVYGLPSLVHNLWLLGRTTPLPFFAPEAEIERVRRLLAVFDLDRRSGFFDLRPLVVGEAAPFWEQAGHRLHALQVDHGPPTCAIRWDLPAGARVVYSSDTRPFEPLAEFGRGAALFVHEATFADAEADRARRTGHSTPGQAGHLATLASAQRLLLVHLTIDADPARWMDEARTTFSGPIDVPDDGATYSVA